ncbi:MAG: hypothetical protein U0807_12170 [Candidatus Binatia bacterium]
MRCDGGLLKTIVSDALLRRFAGADGASRWSVPARVPDQTAPGMYVTGSLLVDAAANVLLLGGMNPKNIDRGVGFRRLAAVKLRGPSGLTMWPRSWRRPGWAELVAEAGSSGDLAAAWYCTAAKLAGRSGRESWRRTYCVGNSTDWVVAGTPHVDTRGDVYLLQRDREGTVSRVEKLDAATGAPS